MKKEKLKAIITDTATCVGMVGAAVTICGLLGALCPFKRGGVLKSLYFLGTGVIGSYAYTQLAPDLFDGVEATVDFVDDTISLVKDLFSDENEELLTE